MTATSAYKLTDLRKANSASFALEIKSLSILYGGTVCLVGPIGAGKSTLLRLLSGLEKPCSGRIEFCGHSIEGDQAPLEVLRRAISVHQNPLLLSGSVLENMSYPLRVRGIPSASDRAERMLAKMGLRSLINLRARTLSGGQRQLVAIGRALVVDPEILLLDEPTAHLDPANVALVEGLIQEQKQRRGTTIVWATHNLFQARRVASNVGFLLHGRLIEFADNKTFFDSPTNVATADFVQGKMVY